MESELLNAVEALAVAKAQENAAETRRLQAEQAVLALLGDLPHEGTRKEEVGRWKLTVSTSIRRTVDAELLASIADVIPDAVGTRLIRWKPELQLRELRFIEANEPAIYDLVADAITAKPAKPTLKLEPLENSDGD